MNQGMTISFLQSRELLSWSIKISSNKLNPLKSISWIPPWGPDSRFLPVCSEINPAVPAAAKETYVKSPLTLSVIPDLIRNPVFSTGFPLSRE
jgi:hypothetical protein